MCSAVLVTGCFSEPSDDAAATTSETASAESTSGTASSATTASSASSVAGSTTDDPATDDAPADDTSTTPPASTTDTPATDTGEGTQCPACSTGFCTDDGTCAWAVFVSSMRFDGNLGGLTGADQWCNNLAADAGLPGQYMAWLSSSTLDAGQRLVGHSEPYVLVDGTLVADEFSVFTTHDADIEHVYLQHAIDTSELGDEPPRGTACAGLPAGLPVWTGTITTGTWNTDSTCNDWTSADPSDQEASVADARQTDSFWTHWCSEVACDTTASIYCFQTGDA